MEDTPLMFNCMGQDTKHDNPDKKPQPPAQGGMYPPDLVMLVGALLHWCCVPSFDEGRGTSCQPMRTPHDLDSRSLPTTSEAIRKQTVQGNFLGFTPRLDPYNSFSKLGVKTICPYN